MSLLPAIPDASSFDLKSLLELIIPEFQQRAAFHDQVVRDRFIEEKAGPRRMSAEEVAHQNRGPEPVNLEYAFLNNLGANSHDVLALCNRYAAALFEEALTLTTPQAP